MLSRYGMPYVWLLDPKIYTLETYELHGAELALIRPRVVAGAGSVRAVPFRLADLWT